MELKLEGLLEPERIPLGLLNVWGSLSIKEGL